MKRTFIWVSALIIILPSLAGAQSLKKDPRIGSALHLLELWLDAQSAYEKISGISMAVVHDQELLWAKGFGYADRENKSPGDAGRAGNRPLGHVDAILRASWSVSQSGEAFPRPCAWLGNTPYGCLGVRDPLFAWDALKEGVTATLHGEGGDLTCV
jgi:hypothetical protein